MIPYRADPHTHCRDEEWSYKATIAGTLQLALEQGVRKIVDMPNLPRPVIDRKRVSERLALVPDHRKDDYYLWIGATSDENQLEEAVWCVRNIPEVVGIKQFAGKSVGPLANTELGQQRTVYSTLARLKYTGPMANHCEKEVLLEPKKWDPENIFTHYSARPPEAEIMSVYDQIRLVGETGFEGKLHICHVSCPESVDIIDSARDDIRITCEVTPHHLMWAYDIMGGENGVDYKMNPPLRSPRENEVMRNYVREGKIDMIGSDHAPHSRKNKREDYMSGYPSLGIYRGFIDKFLKGRLGLDDDQIDDMTYNNVVNLLGEL